MSRGGRFLQRVLLSVIELMSRFDCHEGFNGLASTASLLSNREVSPKFDVCPCHVSISDHHMISIYLIKVPSPVDDVRISLMHLQLEL